MADCCLIKKVATVEVYENKNEVRAYGFMAGDKNTPMMEVKFRHLWGEENLSKCKLRWIIVDDLGSLLVGEVSIEQDNTASIQLPNELFTGERRMKVQLTVASCDGSRILNLQQFTDLKVINNLATNEVVEPVYQMLINQVYDDTKKYLAELETSYKAKYGSLESVYAKSKASLEQYLITAENGGNAEFLQGYNPKNFNRVENTINELINSAGSKYKVGDVVEVLGYYTAGDGAHHKRKIESADDGSGVQLANGLWANIVHNGEVNVSWFGARGDGVTDDSDKILKTFAYAKTFDYHKTIIVPNKIFVVKQDLIIEFGDVTITGGGTFKYSEEGKPSDFHIKKCLHFKGLKSPSAPLRNIKIENITIDMTLQKNKGGRELSDLKKTSIMPAVMDGAHGISAEFVSHFTVDNCSVIDVYGDGIRIWRGFDITITNSKVLDCGGSGIGHGMLSDRFGDGIVCFFSKKCYVTNNFVKNTRMFLDDFSNGNVLIPSGKKVTDYLCGRSGLEFEYRTNNDNVENSDVVEYENKGEIGVIFDNNWVEGYAKGIHLEASTYPAITNNSIIRNYLHIMVQHVSGAKISGNTFDGESLPTWIQSGYHIYTNSVAVSEYGGPQRDSFGNMCFINGNRFLKSSKIMYNTFSTKISENYFENGTIYETGMKLTGELVVEKNIFINDENFPKDNISANVRNYGNKKMSITGNSFYNVPFELSVHNNTDLHKTDDVFEMKAINLERIPIVANITDNYFVGCYVSGNASYRLGVMNIEKNVFLNNTNAIFFSTAMYDAIIKNNYFTSFGKGLVMFANNIQGIVGSSIKIEDNKFRIHKPLDVSGFSTKYLVTNNNANLESDVFFKKNTILVETDVEFEVAVFNTFWNNGYMCEATENTFRNLNTERDNSLNRITKSSTVSTRMVINKNINCLQPSISFGIRNGLYLDKGFTKFFEAPCTDNSVGFVVTKGGISGTDMEYKKVYYANSYVSTFETLDTPYYTTKMQQENVYEDFVSYIDAKLEYDKEQRYLEEQRQLAFESREDQEQTYEERLATQPVLIPDNEPQPSEKLLEFKNKYIV